MYDENGVSILASASLSSSGIKSETTNYFLEIKNSTGVSFLDNGADKVIPLTNENDGADDLFSDAFIEIKFNQPRTIGKITHYYFCS